MLRPPYNGTYRLTAFFDHSSPNYQKDGRIVIYNGESTTDCNPHCYDGHSGYDWAMYTGTQVLAAADGAISFAGVLGNYGNAVIINHLNGYRTLYAHLSQVNVVQNQTVRSGDVVALSGSTGNSTGPHLHFGAYRGPYTSGEDNVTDPFGWRGSYPDPLLNFGPGHTATCLWFSADQDSISCADIIVEDAGRGSTISGYWLSSVFGNGFHMYYRPNLQNRDFGVLSSWLDTTNVEGYYKVYAYVPSISATTQFATYYIWDGSNYQASTINQNSFSDVWVRLGTSYHLPANDAYVLFYPDTGEPSLSTLVAADAIKFRSYILFLPIIMNQGTPIPPPPPAPPPYP